MRNPMSVLGSIPRWWSCAAVLVLLTFAAPAEAQRNIDVKPLPGAVSPSRFYGNSWAVIIGINDYQHPRVPKLRYAVNDARAVEEALLGQGFRRERITMLTNEQATKAKIESVLGDQLRGLLSTNDRLLVFFAGHGKTDRLHSGDEEGYLVPVDGDPSQLFSTAISMESLRKISDRLRAKHILFIMDACYSGYAIYNRSISDDLLEEMVRKPAIQILTAGRQGDEAQERGGQGIFTEVLVRGIRGEAFSAKSWLSLEELGIWVKQRVYVESGKRQVPQFGSLRGEGQFVFLRPGALLAAPAERPVRPPTESPGSAAGNRDADELWHTATNAISRGELAAAVMLIERFTSQFPADPRWPEAHLLLGKTRLILGQPEAALEVLRRYQTLPLDRGQSLDGKLWEAETLLRLKRFIEARAAYESVFRTDLAAPGAPDALYGFGLAELELKRPEPAAAAFRDFLRNWPQHRLAASATLSLATALGDLKRPGEALPLLEEFARKYPGHKAAPNAQYLLGLSRIQTGDRRTGVADLRAFVDTNPSHELTPAARRLVTDTLTRFGDRHDLEETYQALAAQKPPTPETLHDAAGIARRLGRAQDQEAMWRRLTDEFPTHVLARRAALELAGLTFKRKEWPESAAFARAAATSEEAVVKAEAWLQLGESELKLKNFAAAAKAFEVVGTIKDVEPAVGYRALAGLGLAREEQKDWPAAHAAYEAATATPDPTLRDWALKRASAVKGRFGRYEDAR